MTRMFSGNSHLWCTPRCNAVLTILIAAVLSQGPGAGQTPGKPPDVSFAESAGATLPAPERSTNPQLNNAAPQGVGYYHGSTLEAALGLENPLLLPAVNYGAGGGVALPIAVGEVNGDGRPDLIFVNSPTGLGVMLGNGDGTFQPVVNYDSGMSSGNIVTIADINGDTKADLVVTGNPGPGAQVGVLLGRGDGTFRLVAVYRTGGVYAWWLAVADVNGDGNPDVLVVDTWTPKLGVMLGNGDGSFESSVDYSTGGTPSSLSVADLNGDSKVDLVLAMYSESQEEGSVNVLIGNGDGTFQPPVGYFSGGACTRSAIVADVNGDGKPDLVAGSRSRWWWWSPPPVVGILLGNGDGTFQPPIISESAGDHLAEAADVNLDGNLDVIVGTDSSEVGVLLGNGDGTLQPVVNYNSGGALGAFVTSADVNGDSRPDLVVTNGYTTKGVLINNRGSDYSATVTALTSNMNPARPLNQVSYTTKVTSQDGGPVTGMVTFRDGGATLARVPLASNQAAYAATYKTVGSHKISAAYSGDANNDFSSAMLTEQIQAASQMVANTSGSPSLLGEPVTFTANVTSRFGAIPDGERVTFYDGQTAIGTGTTASGVATFRTSSLTAKTHTIKAAYDGDSNFRPSTGTVMQVVSRYPSTTTITSSLNPSIYGQRVSWTAKVTSSAAFPLTGTVAFTSSSASGTFMLGTATLTATGIATLRKSTLNVGLGPYMLTAVYKGDSNNAPSTSPVLNQTVLQTTSAATLTSSVNPSTVAQAITFTAKITSPTVIPSGPVTFKAGTTGLGTAQLNSGKAIFTTSSLPAGATIVKVTYNGNSNIKGSSTSVTQTVQP